MNRRLTDAQVRLEEHAQRLGLLEERGATTTSSESPPADLKVVKLAPARTQALTLRGQSATNEESQSLAGQKARERDFSAARELYQARQCPEGGTAFGRFLANHGEGEFAAAAHYFSAVCDVAAQHYEAALVHLGRAKSAEHEADALHLTAVCYASLGDKTKAREVFSELQTRFSGSEAALRAQTWQNEHPDLAGPDKRPN